MLYFRRSGRVRRLGRKPLPCPTSLPPSSRGLTLKICCCSNVCEEVASSSRIYIIFLHYRPRLQENYIATFLAIPSAILTSAIMSTREMIRAHCQVLKSCKECVLLYWKVFIYTGAWRVGLTPHVEIT